MNKYSSTLDLFPFWTSEHLVGKRRRFTVVYCPRRSYYQMDRWSKYSVKLVWFVLYLFLSSRLNVLLETCSSLLCLSVSDCSFQPTLCAEKYTFQTCFDTTLLSSYSWHVFSQRLTRNQEYWTKRRTMLITLRFKYIQPPIIKTRLLVFTWRFFMQFSK